MSDTSLKTGIAGQKLSGPLPVVTLGISLSLFLAVTFVLCVVYGLLVPKYPMYPAWAPFLPGFTWLTWTGFFIGLIESIAYGWYVALVFAPIYNLIANKRHAAGGLEVS